MEDSHGELFKIVITDLETRVKNNLIDVGHGLSQLIPIVVQTFMPHTSDDTKHHLMKLNIIEQPELHLHPAAQSALADLFVEGIKTSGKRKNYFLIETHSEHMLLRLRRYVVEERIRPEDVMIYYTEKNIKNGSLEVRRLEIDNRGNIFGWPEGFFSVDYQEVLAIRKVLKNKVGRDLLL